MPTRTTPGGVLYEELENSPTFRANDGGMTAVQKWKLDWDQIDALMEEAFPRKPSVGDTITQFQGLRFPSKDWLELTNISIGPFKGAAPSWDAVAGHNKYDKGGAVATLTYGTREGEEEETDPDDDGTLASRELTFGGEFLVLPNAGLSVETERDPDAGEGEGEGVYSAIQNEDVRAAQLLPSVEHSLTMHRVPEIPFNSIAATVGKVNASRTLFDAPAETLLFLGGRASRDKTTRGDTMWELEYRWTQKIVASDEIGPLGDDPVVTWNHVWIPGMGKWLRLKITETSKPVYLLTSFAALFQPDVPPLVP